MNVTITGRLAQDVEVRFTPGGKTVANFSIAESHRGKTPSGDWEDQGTTWWRCQAWDLLAENIAESLTKGTSVVVVGTSKTRKWTDKEGVEKSSLEVTVQDIGPSLRFAIASVTRAQGGQKPAAKSTDDPWGSKPAGGGYDDVAPF